MAGEAARPVSSTAVATENANSTGWGSSAYNENDLFCRELDSLCEEVGNLSSADARADSMQQNVDCTSAADISAKLELARLGTPSARDMLLRCSTTPLLTGLPRSASRSCRSRYFGGRKKSV